jgi:pyruvate ferredoxin oxidoreductase alpha subunit
MGKAQVKRLRQEGKKVGLLRLRLLRPFPHQEIQRVLCGRKGVAVVDQNLSVGKGGILFSEITSALYGLPDRPPVLLSFIGGLGGRRFRPEEFNLMLTLLEAGPERPEEMCQPYLLFTERECREMQRFIAVARAGGESHEA